MKEDKVWKDPRKKKAWGEELVLGAIYRDRGLNDFYLETIEPGYFVQETGEWSGELRSDERLGYWMYIPPLPPAPKYKDREDIGNMKESQTDLEVKLVAEDYHTEPYTCSNCGFEFGDENGDLSWIRYCSNCGGKVVEIDHKDNAEEDV